MRAAAFQPRSSDLPEASGIMRRGTLDQTDLESHIKALMRIMMGLFKLQDIE